MGGVLFIDEAYYLYRPENERDYGQEAIEILLQVMENQRDDLVVILAGYGDRMDRFFESNPGFRSRIAHHVDFPDYSDEELLQIAELLLSKQSYAFSPQARSAFASYIEARRQQPHFANARPYATLWIEFACARPTACSRQPMVRWMPVRFRRLMSEMFSRAVSSEKTTID